MKFISVLLLILTACVTRGATIFAASPNYSDVLTAYNAASPGDIISVPSGDVIWFSTLNVAKAVDIRGAGIGQTIIRKNTGGFFTWSNNVTALFSGFTLSCSANSTSAVIMTIRGLNNVVHDCRFEGTVTKVVGIIASGGTGNPHPTGVVYNCYFSGCRFDVQGDLASSTTQGFGRRIWADLDSVVAFGSSNFIFFEDCTFDLPVGWTGNINDSEYGGHYVVRYSTMKNGGTFCHGITSNSERGARMTEVYHNTYIHEVGHAAPQDPPIRLRGGSAVIWGNTITGTWSTVSNADVMLDNELQRFGDNIGDGNTAVPNGTGTHTGSSNVAVLTDATKSWTTNAFVGWTVYNLTDGSLGTITANTATTVTATLSGGTENDWDFGDSYKVTNGYPLRDQIGRGLDASFWVWDAAGPVQASQPVYIWDNNHEGGAITLSIANNSGGWIQADRDYFNNTAMPGYVPYTYPHPLRNDSVAPVITSNPVSQTVASGANATFTAAATGTPTPTWQWSKGGSPIVGATSSTYVITGAVGADAGSYAATATNSAGTATTSSATLTVTTAPDPATGTPGTPVITGILP